MKHCARTILSTAKKRTAPQWAVGCLLVAFTAGCSGGYPPSGQTSTQTRGDLEFHVSLLEQTGGIADPVTLTLSATAPLDTKITLPAPPDRWGDLHVVAVEKPHTSVTEDNRRVAACRLSLEAYAPGRHVIPALEAGFRSQDTSGSEARVLHSDPLVIHVRSAAGLFATPAAFRDVVGIVPLRRGWAYWAPRAMAVLAIAGVAGMALARMRKRFSVGDSPATWAKRELDRLDQHRLHDGWAADQIITEVVGVLGGYLKRCHDLDGLHLTTNELLARAESSPQIDDRQRVALRDFLSQSDRAKFARWEPTVDDAREAVRGARQIVSSGESAAAGPANVNHAWSAAHV